MISNRLARLVLAICEKNKLDITLSKFLASCTKIFIIIMVGVICLGKIGISVTPLVAAIGAASLGAGLAMQGLLSNYAAGLNIILTRPFVVGDTIIVQGVTGIVDEVRLAQTMLTDEDEVTITTPIGILSAKLFITRKPTELLRLPWASPTAATPGRYVTLSRLY